MNFKLIIFICYIYLFINKVNGLKHALLLSIHPAYWDQDVDVLVKQAEQLEHIRVLYYLTDHRFIVAREETKGRQLIGGNQLTAHTDKFVYDNPTNKLFIHSCDKPQQIIDSINKKLYYPVKTFELLSDGTAEQDQYNYHFLIDLNNHRDKFVNETIYQLKQHPSVVWIMFHQPHKTQNNDAIPLLISPQQKEVPIEWGKDELITVGDTGVDMNSCFFAPKGNTLKLTYNTKNVKELIRQLEVIPTEPKIAVYVSMELNDGLSIVVTDFTDGPNEHGTHVCGSAAGDDSTCPNSLNKHRSKAQIMLFDFDNAAENNTEGLIIPPILTPLLQLSYHAGSRIFTNSWGSATSEYTFTSMELDKFVYFHDDYFILFANGNAGPNTMTVGSPATFKNGLSVGASQNTYHSFLNMRAEYWADGKQMLDEGNLHSHHESYGEQNLASFSSRGPTADGRIKPDIVAPGEYILSARSQANTNSPYLLMRGTSMATPVTANVVSLIRSVLLQRENISPSWFLIKNIIITTAVPLKGSAQQLALDPLTGLMYSFTHRQKLTMMDVGWGRVDIETLLRDELSWMDRQVIKPFNAPIKYSFIATKNEEVSIGLVWPDPPAYMRSDKVLINDLNLRVIIKNSDNGNIKNVIHGNHGIFPDFLNPTERVRVKVNVLDEVIVIVSSTGPIINIPPVKHQLFSLVWSKSLSLIGDLKECSRWDPPYECMTESGMKGWKACVDKQYSTVCSPLCGEGLIFTDVGCNCNIHLPCGDSLTSTGIQFALCDGQNLTQCQQLYPTWERAKKRGTALHRLLAIDTSEPVVHGTLWLILNGGMIVAVLLYFYSFRKFN